MTCSPTTLLAEGTSFQSMGETQFQMAVLQLLCDISASGGGGGAAQVFQGTGSPTNPPTAAGLPALYTDLTTGVIYTWNVITQAWF